MLMMNREIDIILFIAVSTLLQPHVEELKAQIEDALKKDKTLTTTAEKVLAVLDSYPYKRKKNE